MARSNRLARRSRSSVGRDGALVMVVILFLFSISILTWISREGATEPAKGVVMLWFDPLAVVLVTFASVHAPEAQNGIDVMAAFFCIISASSPFAISSFMFCNQRISGFISGTA